MPNTFNDLKEQLEHMNSVIQKMKEPAEAMNRQIQSIRKPFEDIKKQIYSSDKPLPTANPYRPPVAENPTLETNNILLNLIETVEGQFNQINKTLDEEQQARIKADISSRRFNTAAIIVSVFTLIFTIVAIL